MDAGFIIGTNPALALVELLRYTENPVGPGVRVSLGLQVLAGSTSTALLRLA